MSFTSHNKLLRRIAAATGHHHHHNLSSAKSAHQHAPRKHLSCLAPVTSQTKSGNFKWCKHAVTIQSRNQSTTTTTSTQVLRTYVDPKLSYAFGRSHEHLIYSTVGRELDRRVQAAPDEVPFISHSEGISVTFKQFNEDINRLAKSLVTKFNIRKGDFVGVFAYNCYNWLPIQYACSRVGAVITPINPSYKAHELAYILKRGKIKCLFMPGYKSEQAELNDHRQVISSRVILDLFSDAKEGATERPLLESVILLDGDGGKYTREDLSELKYPLARYCKFHDWHEATQQTDGRVFKSAREADEAGVHLDDACILSPELVSPDDLFAVYYTSGTTGKPKGACVSHFTVTNNVRMCQIRLRHGRPRDWRIVGATTLPMFHMFAGVLTILSPIMAKGTVMLTSHKYDIAAYAEGIIKHGANFTALTPTILIDLLTYVEQHPELGEMPLKFIQPGGSMVPPELIARAFRILPQLEEVRTGYGSTENGAVATFQTIYEPDATKATTAGTPIDLTEVRIVSAHSDPTTGQDGPALPLGEMGEIQTRGYNTMVGYLDDPVKTREVITPNRWYRTGDIGFMHPHGSITISGRLKHMLIKGGENIYPEEVEQMMHEMECIEKVHVVGVPDKRFGEQVCAWVKLQPGYVGTGGDYHEPRQPDGANGDAKTTASLPGTNQVVTVTREEILQFCMERITYFKVPKYIFFVNDFPMTPTKKVQNHEMVKQSIEILKLSETSG